MSTEPTTPGEAPPPDNAVAFLKLFRPQGPWVVVAISAELNPRTGKKNIETRTFYPSTEEKLRGWLEKWNGARNLYFAVNSLLQDFDGIGVRFGRKDVKSVDYLHVDIDPRAGEDFVAERERILARLRDPPDRIPKPTFVNDSGGGFQGFWKLREPIPINGDLALAEEAERYNRALELSFGADRCHDVDRIMRLPGTVNLPDKRKQAKGRVPALAGEVEP